MLMRKIILVLAVLLPLLAGARKVQGIDDGWQFLKAAQAGAV